MNITVKIVHDGARNTSIQITGAGSCSWREILCMKDLSPIPREVRIDAVYYAVSDGQEVQFAWGEAEGQQAFLPVSGRGRIDFGEVSGIHNTALNKTGNLHMQVMGAADLNKIFTIILDLSKHIGVANG